MGSAPSNRGVPATPRDGAPIECSALLYSTLRWLEGLPDSVFPHRRVEWTLDSDGATWGEWADRIEMNWRNTYYIPQDADDALVNRRGIYRDVVGPVRKKISSFFVYFLF